MSRAARYQQRNSDQNGQKPHDDAEVGDALPDLQEGNVTQ